VFYELILRLLQSGLFTFEKIIEIKDLLLRCRFILFAFEQEKDFESILVYLNNINEIMREDLELL
jgi:hypothetical protein